MQIGQGAYSTVHKTTQGGKWVAIKEAKDEMWQFALKEIILLKFLCSPNITSLLGVDCDNYTLAFRMPCAQSTLEAFLQRVSSANEAKPAHVCTRYMADVCSAVAYCHSAGVTHGDIKPANVLIDGHKAILCDFGLARVTPSSRGVIQSVMYRAPEVTMGYIWRDKVDVWSIGVVWLDVVKTLMGEHLLGSQTADTSCPLDIYKAIFGSPFDGSRQQTTRVIMHQLAPCVSAQLCPAWASTLITRCLCFDPGERISSLDMYNIVLRHVPGEVQIAEETFLNYLAKKEPMWARSGTTAITQFIDANLRNPYGCESVPSGQLAHLSCLYCSGSDE